MVPSALVELESFPLTVNGKLDKSALPDPDLSSSEDYVAPGNEVEQVLSKVWQEVLGLDRVSVTDNFFRIGGDSILSIQVSSRIRQAGFNCHVKDIFEHKTIRSLAQHLSKNQVTVALQSEQELLSGECKFLPIQEWFIDQVESGKIGNANHYNQSFLIRVPALEVSRLQAVIDELVSYHDVLRMQYVREHVNGSTVWRQLYRRSMIVPEVKILDVGVCTPSAISEELTRWQSEFDLAEGRLFQVGYLQGYADGSARIHLAAHHMIIDTVSWRILTEDIKTLYSGKTLGRKGSSYRQWTEGVIKYGQHHPQEREYWAAQLGDIPTYENSLAAGVSEANFELDVDSTSALLHQASQAYHTEINDVLLTALAYALKDINQGQIQGISLEGHGREPIDLSLDTSRTVGWFTSVYPVRLELQSDIGSSLRFIKESLRQIPNKGIGFGVFAVEAGSTYRLRDLPPISFNYLGQFEGGQSGHWQIVGESSGRSQGEGNQTQDLISINGLVMDGKLWFGIATRLGEKQTHALSDFFKNRLTEVIHHCVDQWQTTGVRYTPSDFDTISISQELLDQLQDSARVDSNEIQAIYPANSLQQGFVYHALSQQTDDAYRVQSLFDYHEALDVDKYIQSWQYCIEQYPILRTGFNWEEEIIQIVYQKGKLSYEVHDISHLTSQQERDQALEQIRMSDRSKGFDLRQPCQLRLHIIRQRAEYFTVLKTEHHIVSDGWSGPILFMNLHKHYEALQKGKIVRIQEDQAYLNTQAYIARNRISLQGYWQQALQQATANDISSLLDRGLDVSTYRQVEHPAMSVKEIGGSLYQSLKSFIQREGITLNVIAQFAWHKLLQVYSGSTQTIVGTTISGRDLPVEGIEQSVGLFINTLPLVIDWHAEETILVQLHQIQRKITEMNTHSFATLAKLQKDGERLFHSLFIYENYPVAKESSPGPKVSIRGFAEKLDYPLSISAYEGENKLVIQFGYDEHYVGSLKSEQILSTVEHIIKQVIDGPQQSHHRLSLLTPQEYKQVVYQWNETTRVYAREKTIHGLFCEQVERTPDQTALIYEGSSLSYRDLNQKSNQLAHHIRTRYREKTGQELLPDTLIGLCVDRSLEMVIGVLAILKAGGAYVPIDLGYPQERINYLLEDTAAELVLTQKHIGKSYPIAIPIEKQLIIDLIEDLYKTNDYNNLPPYSLSKHLAYVIYTSGTTGKPKGVMLEHSGIVNRIQWMQSMYPIGTEDVVLQKTPYGFDVSVWELLWAHWYGATIVLAKPGGHKDSEYLTRLIQENNVTTLHFVPSMLDAYNLHLTEQDSQWHHTIKQVFCSGESLTRHTVQQSYLNAVNSLFKIHNLYGPTEASIDVTYYETHSDKNVYIGKAIQNTKAYIVDDHHHPVPIGVIGELYIGGAGLARGYLNKPDLTVDRFIDNPFATGENKLDGYSRLYKTGDLAKWIPDGNIEYVGRNDDQVKIRGHRIELGEIENVLCQLRGVRQCCILARERNVGHSNSKYLVGYYVKDNSLEELSPSMLLDQLSLTLPDYMIPSALIELTHIPLTANGKLDKSALPDADFNSREIYVAPKNETERRMCDIWRDLLGADRVGITDDFFRMGGNSILAIQLSHRINKALGCDIKVADVFRWKTVTMLLENAISLSVAHSNVEWEV